MLGKEGVPLCKMLNIHNGDKSVLSTQKEKAIWMHICLEKHLVYVSFSYQGKLRALSEVNPMTG
jgi:hypothetical protein